MSETDELTASPTRLLELAIQQGSELDKLEKLMDLQERWEAKEAAKSFKIAMVEFQGKKPKLVKSKNVSFSTSNGKTSYNYNPLPKIQIVIDPILSECGLSYRWAQSQGDGKMTVTCIVSHVDGHTEETTMVGPYDGSGKKNQIQSIGSSSTYLKRYTLEGALGLSSDEDDDGETSGKSLPELKNGSSIWDQAVEALKNGTTSIPKILKHYTVTDTDQELLWQIVKTYLAELLQEMSEVCPSEIFKDVSRILDQSEENNYLKACETLKNLKHEHNDN